MPSSLLPSRGWSVTDSEMNKRAVAHRMRQLALMSFALLITLTLMYRALGLFGTGTIHVSRGTNPFVDPRDSMVKVSESMYERNVTAEARAQVQDLIAIAEAASPALAAAAATAQSGDAQRGSGQAAPAPAPALSAGDDNAG
jgi:hypothetical protein